MKNKILSLSSLLIIILLSGCNQPTNTTVEQTICFSQEQYNSFYIGVLGDDVPLNGGQCKGVKLADMNKNGWRLVQVVSGTNNSFGMVFEK